MLNYSQLATAKFMVPAAGGEVTATSAEGEVLWVAGLAPGIVAAKVYREHLEPGDVLAWSEGVTAMLPGAQRARRINFGPGAVETGANPDFKPTVATAAEMRLKKLLSEVNERSNSLDRRLATFSRMSEERAAATSGAASDAEEAPVVEPPVEPEPEAENGAA